MGRGGSIKCPLTEGGVYLGEGKAQREKRYSSTTSLTLALVRGVVNSVPRPLYPRKDPVPTVQEPGWDPGPVRMGAENLTPTGI
jgi:hypothetical protein